MSDDSENDEEPVVNADAMIHLQHIVRFRSLSTTIKNKATRIIGVDEAGRGPWAGPLLVGASFIPSSLTIQYLKQTFKLRDSKKMSKPNLAGCAAWMLAHPYDVFLLSKAVSATSIDETHNILTSTMNTMAQLVFTLRAFLEEQDLHPPWLCKEHIAHVKIDRWPFEIVQAWSECVCPPSDRGIFVLHVHLLQLVLLYVGPFDIQYDIRIDGPKVPFQLTQSLVLKNDKVAAIVKGDDTEPVISAAAVYAKVFRDLHMQQMDQVYPGYDFASNKGYGQPAHIAGLETLGPTGIHRMTYKPLISLMATGSCGNQHKGPKKPRKVKIKEKVCNKKPVEATESRESVTSKKRKRQEKLNKE